MKSKGVLTTYTSGGRCYESYIIAERLSEAEELRRVRNIGERITTGITDVSLLNDFRDLSNEEFLKRLPDIQQQAAFLAYISFASGRLKLEHAIAESSVIQQLMRLPSVGIVTEIIEAARKELVMLQTIAPGVFPPARMLQGKQITVKVKPGTHVTVHNIIPGSQVHNLGPAAVTICDCADPDCGITDDDQPCGYEQTIDAHRMGVLNTESNFVNIVNKDAKQGASVRLMVREGSGK